MKTAHSSARAGITIVGAAFLVGVFVVVVAGAIYLGKKLVDAINRIQIRREVAIYYYHDYVPSDWLEAQGPVLRLESAQPPMMAWGGTGADYRPLWRIEWTEDLGKPWVDLGEIECSPEDADRLIRGLRDWHVNELAGKPKTKSKPSTDPGIGFWRHVMVAD